MIIDLSYFKGGLLLPQLSDSKVAENVNRYIATYEPEYLTKVLGYEFAQDFLAGIQEDPVPQKWVDLLVGAEYTDPNTDRLTKWIGFASVTGGYQLSNTPELVWTVGQAGSPATDATFFTSAKLLNRTYWLERRNFGYMIAGTDYSSTNSGQTITLLKSGDVFQQDEIFVIHFTGYITPATTSSVNLSPIANYVYWKYRTDITTVTTPTGEAAAENQNSTIISPARKMCADWNQMVVWNYSLWQFLWVNRDTYGLSQSDFNSFSYWYNTWYVLKGVDVIDMGNTVNDFDL